MIGPCLNCRRLTRLTNDFCQKCLHRIPAEILPVIRRIVGCERARKRIEEILISICMERPLLVGRIARQHTAIVALRRKYAIPRKFWRYD